MPSKTKGLTGVAAAVIALAGAVPAHAATIGVAPCRVQSVSTGSETAILLHGHFTDTADVAFDVVLTCHIVQGGQRIVSRTDQLDGPVAALASDERIPPGAFRVCYEVETLHLWGSNSRTNC